MRKILTILVCVFYVNIYAQTPNSWSFINYVGLSNGANQMCASASFVIGNTVYVLTGGAANTGGTKQFWKWSPSSPSWVQLPAFNGVARVGGVAFSIGGKGYFGFGYDGTSSLNDFWQYDTTAGWNQISFTTPWPVAFYGGAGFSIGNKGFVGTGAIGSGINTAAFWEFNPANLGNPWTARQPFPDPTGRYFTTGFSIGSKGYIGLGQNGSGMTNDFFIWDTTANVWSPSSISFPAANRYRASAFVIGTKAYIGAGNTGGGIVFSDFRAWDQATQTWASSTPSSMPVGQERFSAVGFAIGNNGYIMGGATDVSGLTTYNDLWKYTPSTPPTPSICEVTVDSLSNYNEIYWKKTLYPQADSFIVYRETTIGNFTRIGGRSAADSSMFIDTLRHFPSGINNGNPNVASWKYKIKLVDSFGNYSAFSPYHSTLFVQDQQNGNFNWNAYAIEGTTVTPVTGYDLVRRDVATGTETIAVTVTIPNTTDPLYSSLWSTGIKWYVDAAGFNCDPTAKVTAQKIKTKSNHANDKVIATKIDNLNSFINNNIVVYPNPAKDKLTLEIGAITENLVIELNDVLGRTLTKINTTESVNTIITSNYVRGIYFLTIKLNNKNVCVKKVIIE